MKQVDASRATLQKFERVDQPAYERWMAQTFGALMTEIRQLDEKVRELESVIAAVDWNVRFHRDSHRQAYQRVMQARSSQVEFPFGDEDDAEPGASRDPAQDLDELEAEMLFEEMLEDVLGINPARMDDAEYQEMFEQFKESIKSGQFKDPFDDDDDDDDGFFDDFWDDDEDGKPSQASAGAMNGSDRLKQLYRQLVRRLHPDVRADGDATVSAVWHQVQEAYQRGDVERLETLMAFTDLHADAVTEHTLLSQIYAVVDELKETLSALKRTIKESQRSYAWDFGAKPLDRIQKKIETGMNEELEWLNARRSELEAVIEPWKRTRSRRKR